MPTSPTASAAPTLGELVSAVADWIPQPRRLGWRRRLAWGMRATDAVAVAVALYTAQVVRFAEGGLGPTLPGISRIDVEYALVGALLGLVWLVALSGARSRLPRNISTGLVEYERVLQATLVTFGTFAIVAYLLRLEVARGYLAIAFPLGLVLLIGSRVGWRACLHAMRRAGRCMTGAIVVGSEEDVLRVLHQLRRHYRIGYRAIAVSMPDGPPAASGTAPSGPVLPFIPLDRVAEISKSRRARAVIVAGSLPGGNDAIRRLGWDLENAQVELILMSQLTDVAGPRIHMRPISGLPMVHVDLPQYSGFNHVSKRLFDMVVVALGLLVTAPVFAAIAIAIRLDGGGPIIFRQERVGAHGTRFTMLKFRTMVVDAETRLAALRERNDGAGVLFKLRDDPRVTRVGRFLRAYSLDELPQLWNVLRGDMSLVGPRPPLPDEVAQYEGHVSRRLLTRPGITGLWQISGRSNLSWEESVRLDLYYVENWSVSGDVVVLVKTAKAVVRRDGAY